MTLKSGLQITEGHPKLSFESLGVVSYSPSTGCFRKK